MLQVALGGYFVYSSSSTVYDATPTFYEPGYNIMSALELGTPECDQVMILIRQRSSSGGYTSPMNYNSYTFSAEDAVTGESVNYSLRYNTVGSSNYQAGWATENTGFVITVDNSSVVGDPLTRIRLVDCLLSNNITNDFVRFRIAVEDSNKLFYYLAMDQGNIKDRPSTSTAAIQTSVNVNGTGDMHVIISPFASFYETTSELSTFSYPLETIYYNRQSVHTNEDFNFSFTSSDPNLPSYLSIITIPKYQKVGVLMIAKYTAEYILTLDTAPYVDVTAYGMMSEITETLKIYLGI